MKTLQQLYDEYEGDFIDAMVNHFNFSGKKDLVFRKRFIKDNDGCLHEPLAQKCKKQLVDEDNEVKAGQTFRQTLASICAKLEEMKCPPSEGVDRWKNCRRWLREEMFAQWAKEQGLIKPRTIEECWNELKTKAENSQSTTDKEKQSELIVEKWEPQLADMGARRNIKRQKFPANSDLTYRVISPQSGHLMLFEREPNGTIICLCPSEFAPSSYHAGKETKLPLSDSEYESFGSDELGWEQLLAVITPELPPFQWLEDSRKEALEVNQEHLAGILDYVNGQTNAEVLYTQYLVVASQG
ncbi:MAG: DUF4384 domain-containing protein [Microcoleus sp. PH2017_39_LGB_O_B]|uniref:DUF4384 domain-containing protein n=1 Tax=unclassified Microcoleus TaxID=2642155 RepID=UPI001E0326D2|nr:MULTISPECIES: DUF4384 domain-containing protein [unclassified Microcoleus]MCC3450316.1 DUF4384 domain-containing protein [Microcoleus sp. PH2017_09_SFU_O_A]MCC3631197.1 DUF4384 domain-containing protein [Microcoleus sp. PH2017_39_LGB_O_B]MCC3643408.1 DUF4384 domain-containing protein [Microcoleus sp. PH2017_33_LGB_O_A]TAF87282.1 MAG: DUF4384 domain-containing protein [Oscillatoriales cyanobacterium]